jgi:hypothetical protein
VDPHPEPHRDEQTDTDVLTAERSQSGRFHPHTGILCPVLEAMVAEGSRDLVDFQSGQPWVAVSSFVPWFVRNTPLSYIWAQYVSVTAVENECQKKAFPKRPRIIGELEITNKTKSNRKVVS